jgi:hypothetical protein
MQDKHIAHRNLHLVAAGAMPVAPGSEQYRQDPQAVLLDFNNPRDEELVTDIVFERATYPGHLSVLLPKLPELSKPAGVLDGFRVVAHERGVLSGLRSVLGEALESVGETLEGLGELIEPHADLAEEEPEEESVSPDAKRTLKRIATLDRTRLYVADAVERPRFNGIRLPAGGTITAALILQAPVDARPGDRYGFHVIQQDRAGRVLGGSSYIFAVTKQTPVRVKPGRRLVKAVTA